MPRTHGTLRVINGLNPSLTESRTRRHTLAGLRAKALLVWWEVAPTSTTDPADWQWPDDDDATYSLCRDVVELTGPAEMFERYEDKFARVAEEIDLANEADQADDEKTEAENLQEELATFRCIEARYAEETKSIEKRLQAIAA